MRVHVISDIEGVAGIVKWGQTGGDHEALPRGARPLHRGDQRGRARREGRRRDRDRRHGLPRRGRRLHVQLARPGSARPGLRVRRPERVDGVHGAPRAGLRRRAVRRHARDGGERDGVLSHTVSGQAWQNLRFNGTLVGETGINAALCGHWGCPVLLVTGDRAVCGEARALLGAGLTTVEVKVGLGRFSARQQTPKRARELIEAGAKQALSDLHAVPPYDPGKAVRDRDRVHVAGPPDRVREPEGRRGAGRAHARRPRRRLVERLVGVLLLTWMEPQVVRISIAPVKSLGLVHPGRGRRRARRRRRQPPLLAPRRGRAAVQQQAQRADGADPAGVGRDDAPARADAFRTVASSRGRSSSANPWPPEMYGDPIPSRRVAGPWQDGDLRLRRAAADAALGGRVRARPQPARRHGQPRLARVARAAARGGGRRRAGRRPPLPDAVRDRRRRPRTRRTTGSTARCGWAARCSG